MSDEEGIARGSDQHGGHCEPHVNRVGGGISAIANRQHLG